MITKEEAVKLWKELGVTSATMDFYCGGDSMGETTWALYTDEGHIENSDLESYLDDEVYRRVDFYVNSDGHYQGESGNVEVELYDDEDDFSYSKSSTSEYSESYSSTIEIELTPEMVAFIETNVSNINGGYDDRPIINFSRDFIMTNEEETILAEIESLIDTTAEEFSPEQYEGDLEEWYTYTTNERGDTLSIVDNKLQLHIQNSITVYRED